MNEINSKIISYMELNNVYEDNDIVIKRFSDCSFQVINDCWHSGFDDEYTRIFGGTPYRFTLEQLVTRFAIECYSLRLSLIAFCKKSGKAIGLVCGGIREFKPSVQPIITSWNGGTAIIPEFRNKGICKKLMTTQFELLKSEANVNVSTLEVVLLNKPALALYKTLGYIEDGCFLNMEFKGTLIADIPSTTNKYLLKQTSVQEISKLPFYPNFRVQWQTQWESFIMNGEGIQLQEYDSNLNEYVTIGYALLRYRYDDNLNKTIIALRQIQINPNQKNFDTILEIFLLQLLQPNYNCIRNIVLPPSMPIILKKAEEILLKLNFQKTTDVLCMHKIL